MGIANFQKFTKSVYGGAYRNIWKRSYDNIYFDLNHILHHVGYVANSRQNIYSRLKDYLVNILRSTYPTKRVILTADGPAPLAKLLVQRKRRLQMIRGMSEDQEIESTSSLNFTPGSDFMMMMMKELEDLVQYLITQYNVEVILNLTDPNEGEIKIKSKILEYSKECPTDTHLISSGDSDMILLLASCERVDGLYMILSKDDTISIGEMMRLHREKYGGTATTGDDFMFINLLMGNDYTPKLGLIKMENIWESYKKICDCYPDGMVQTDGDNVTIDPMFFHDLIYWTINKSPKHLQFLDFKEIDQPVYDSYIEGLVWCFGMYRSGICKCYQYIYCNENSPNPWGVVFNIMVKNVHKLRTTKPIDSNVYGLLLIPEKASNLLDRSKKQTLLKVVEKFPIIYEEEKCAECAENYKLSQDLSFRQKQLNESSSDITEDKKKLTKEKAILGRKILKHRTQHKTLTFKDISTIQDYYLNILPSQVDKNIKSIYNNE